MIRSKLSINIVKHDCEVILRSIDDSTAVKMRLSEKTAKITGMNKPGNLKMWLSALTLEKCFRCIGKPKLAK